jgi:DNA polymerase V
MTTHGGHRPGAGRKAGSGIYGEPTVVVRIPASLKRNVLDYCRLECAQSDGRLSLQRPARDPSRLRIPLFAHRVPAGFPSPADDYVEDRLDLNELLVQNSEATYFIRVKGDSMVGAGIHPGDLIVVDRSLAPLDGHVVVAEVDGDLTVKRLRFVADQPELHPENPGYPVIRFKEGQELRVWGVVTSAVHAVR